MRYLLALVVTVFLCPAVFGQFSGRLTGTVVDATGAAVPGAEVQVYLPGGTKPLLVTRTSNEGIFHFIGVRPSYYDLVVTAKGFAKSALRNISVDPALETSLPAIKLELPTVTQSVDVSANAQTVETSNAEVSGVITMEEVNKLPLLDRDPLALIQTQPGVVFNGNSNTVINGMRTSYANMTLDGINIQDNYIRDNALDFTPNKLLMGQVRQLTLVTSNANSAAPNGAAQVAFETPSGTNEFHGDGFWYNRNNYFAANDWFNNQAGIPRSFLNQNELGGSIGGPIKRDKLFFYANYEAVRTHQQQGADPQVLTPDARTGIFTYVDNRNRVQKVNLLTLRKISIDPYMQNLLNQVPTTINNFEAGDSSAQLLKNTAGYRFNQRSNEIRDNITGRVDYNLSTKNVFTGTYAWNRFNLDRPDAENDYSVIPKATDMNHSHFLSSAWRWTPSARLTNELRGGFNLAPGDFLTSQQFGQFLITGTLFNDPVNEFLSQGRATKTYQLSDNAAYQRGRHYLQFGFYTNQIRVRPYNNAGILPTYVLAMGVNQPALQRSELPGISSTDLDTANALLATLGGYVDEYDQTFNITSRKSGFVPGAGNIRRLRLSEYDVYAQDQWKVLPRLTLTLGLRYMIPGIADEVNSLELQPIVQNHNPVQTLLSNATLDFAGGSVGRPWYKRDLHDFGPNVGLAWDVFGNGRTAFRAAYSLAYVNDQSLLAPTDTTEINSGLSKTVSTTGLSDRVSTGLTKIPVPVFHVPLTVADNYADNPQNTVGLIDPNLKTPYVQQYSFGIQQEFRNTVFELRYVGNHAVRGYRAFDYNQVQIVQNGFLADFLRAQSNGFLALQANPKGGFDPTYNAKIPGSQQLTVFPKMVQGGILGNAAIRNLIETGQPGQLATVYQVNGLNGPVAFFANPNALGTDILNNYSNSTYNSLQFSVRRRARSGLTFLGNYTFSKVLSDAAGDSQSRLEQFLDVYNPKLERARANFDLTHAIKGAVTYDLPVGKGHFVNFRPLDRVIGGWSVGTILTWQSGPPFSILSGYATLNRTSRSYYNGANTTLTKSQLDGLVKFQMTGNGPKMISSSAVNPTDHTGVNAPGDAPFTGQVFFNPGAGTLGGLQRRMFSGPWTFNLDASLQKDIRITERQSLQLRMEGTNVLNHATFFSGDQNINSPQFGVIGSMFYQPRIMQFALYYKF